VDPVKEISLTSGSVTTGVRPARQHVQQARGQPGLLEDPGQRDTAAHGGARIGLEHHGVAQGQRGRHRADGQDLREVERRDHADHADRDPFGEAEPGLLAGQQLTVGARGQRGGLVDLLGRDVGLEGHRGRDFAALPDSPPLDVGRVGQPQVGGAAQQGRPLGVRRRRPGRLRGRRELGRAGHVGRGRDPNPAELGAGRGLGHRSVAAAPVDPAARVDLAAPDGLVHECHDRSHSQQPYVRRTIVQKANGRSPGL
jgi:hypothetical protein